MMREHQYFDDGIHKKYKNIVESIVLDNDSMMNHHRKLLIFAMTRGDGRFHKVYVVLLTHGGLYSTVDKTLPAKDGPYETMTSSLIQCGTDSLLGLLLSGKEFNGLKVPRYFDFIKRSLGNHPNNMDVKSFLDNLGPL